MEVNIELKTGIYWYPKIEEKVIEVVKEWGMQKRVIYSSFNHYSVQRVKELNPDAEVAYLFSDVILDVENYAKRSGVQGIHPPVYHLNMCDFMERYKKSNLKIRVWTVNEDEWIDALIREKVEAMITNYPEKALNIREALKDA